jgi:catechol 2,3-dioxygenase-like lactoylglutathione lyase family enzyme
MSVATETVLAAEQTGEYAPIRLNHLAYVTHDTAATVRFWTKVMQMPLVEAVMHERVPSTGDPFPYVHFFFRMQDGSTSGICMTSVQNRTVAAVSWVT